MAIGTDSAIQVFGTQTSLDNTSGAVANDAFSVAGDLNQFTNSDDALSASVILEANFSVAPTVNTNIHLYLRHIDFQSTNDATIPDANFQHFYVGSFPLNDSTVAQFVPIIISLPNVESSQVYEFYVENKSGQSMPAGWDLHITPTAIAPAA